MQVTLRDEDMDTIAGSLKYYRISLARFWRSVHSLEANKRSQAIDAQLFKVLIEYVRYAYPLNRRIGYWKRIAKLHPEFDDVRIKWWISDTYVLTGRYDLALRWRPCLNSLGTYCAHYRMSLKKYLGLQPDIHDLWMHQTLPLTAWGRLNAPKVKREAAKILGALRWPKTCWSGDYTIYVGSNSDLKAPFRLYSFDEFKIDWSDIRKAENAARKKAKIPLIGEGWIGETELFHSVRKAFPNLEVVHHGSPHWLGQQHLDVWLPSIKLAIEYHGPQHFKPVEFFGGEVAFQKQIERDQRKMRRCKRHGVDLIIVKKGYKFDQVAAAIETSLIARDTGFD